jgi:hypothetical protein
MVIPTPDGGETTVTWTTSESVTPTTAPDVNGQTVAVVLTTSTSTASESQTLMQTLNDPQTKDLVEAIHEVGETMDSNAKANEAP